MDNDDLLKDGDAEFELEILRDELLSDEQKAEIENEKKRQRETERKKYEDELKIDKVELAKLRSGVIEDSDRIKEEHEAAVKLKGWAYIKNFVYHNKLMIAIIAMTVAFGIYLIYDLVSIEKFDVKILVFPDNGIAFRTDELSEYLEKFAPDVNDDGKVVVKPFAISLNANQKDPNLVMSNNAKLMAELQSGGAVIVIADKATTELFQADETLVDMTTVFPDNENVDRYGYKFYSEDLKSELKWQQMPEDMYIGLRMPRKTVSDSEKTMRENYDIAKQMLEKIIEDIEK